MFEPTELIVATFNHVTLLRGIRSFARLFKRIFQTLLSLETVLHRKV